MQDEVSADHGADEPLINRAQLASIFGVSENTIDKWRAKGMPVKVEGGNGVAYGFSSSACRAWHSGEEARAASEKAAADEHVNRERAAFLGLVAEDQKAGLSPSQMRDMAQAELVWMQAAQRRGDLIPAAEISALLDGIFTEFRAGLDGFPDWLEREFALSAHDVERVISYCDELLRATSEAIAAANISAASNDDLEDGARLI